MISFIFQHFAAINWVLIAITIICFILMVVFGARDASWANTASSWATKGTCIFGFISEGMSIWSVASGQLGAVFILQLVIASIVILLTLALLFLFFMAKPYHEPTAE